MDKEVYNPVKLAEEYYCYRGHTTKMFNKIHDAIRQADLHNDIPYMLYFREELCKEAGWYMEAGDIVRIFKEALALIDKYPDLERTYFQRYSKDAVEPLLWEYETFLNIIISFDSISLEEYRWYLDDFRRRFTVYGYGGKEPYRMELGLYLETGDIEGAEKLWQEYKKTPAKFYDRDKNYITDVKYYLLHNETEKAEQAGGAQQIYTRRCLLEYYLVNGDYKKAEEISYIMEHSCNYKKEVMSFASFMCAYAYNRPGRGLRIYKKYWKEWEKETNPQYKYYTFKNAACFFKALKEVKGTDVIKLKTGSPVPSSEGDNIYSTDMLYKYYYKEAGEIAKRFDKRNGTGKYTKELEMSFNNVLSYNP